ncbi:Variable major outer membrane lipoprotein (plasmid) [Borrelia hermsii YBT]|uniref:Variable large protein n=1 Tax=Borrelia hermsii YBT TaxID=1313295 RepID=W5T2M5_BORHE|nr:variable large family protein [Borrelia hermsii]AHH13183.1 Variable major outer membrane lipoprotein [Borrelia hermsii YBT]
MSGGIALCSLVKDGGKLALHSSNDNKGVEVAGATNKLLGAIKDIIRETVKKVFDKVKQEVDSE